MIESSLELGKRPTFFDKLSAAGQQRIKEYEDTLAFRSAVEELNAALEPHREHILKLKPGNPPIRLKLGSEEGSHQPAIGSWRKKISVSAIRDREGIISLRSEVRSDDLHGYKYFDIHRGHIYEKYHNVCNEIAVLRIDKNGAIQTVSYGLVDETRDRFIFDIWNQKEFIATPEIVNDRGEQANAIQFLSKLLT